MPSNSIALPSPRTGWTLFSGDKVEAHGESLLEVAGKRTDVVVGVPAASTSIFVVSLPETESSLYESMVFAQIEKRGLADRHGTTLFDFEKVESGPEGNVFVVTVVPSFPEKIVLPTAAGYATAASLRNHGESPCLLYREHGRLVLAVFIGRHPAHLQLLGTQEIGAAAAGEINLALLSLRGESAFSDREIGYLEVAASDIPEMDFAEFENALTIPVTHTGDSAAVKKPHTRDRLLPAEVTRARARHRNLRRNTVIGIAALIAYLVIGSWIFTSARQTRERIESLESQIEIVQPDVERIQLAEQRWRQLEPAFNLTYFPVVQLSRITSALPGSGVVVREFRTSGRAIRVRGQARDVQLANRLLEDLQGMDAFEAYSWSMAKPRMENNNTATFEIEGRPKNEIAQ